MAQLTHIFQKVSHLRAKLCGQINGIVKQVIRFKIQTLFSVYYFPSGSSCTSNITNSREWLQKNYGQFVVFAEYRDLVNLNSNFSGLEALDLLTPVQIADLTLDPKVGALNNVGMINKIFDGLQNHSQDRQLYDFFTRFANITMQNNMTVINNTDVRTAMLNRTFVALSPAFPIFNSTVWKDWFQTKLVLLLPSINPGTLETIPKNITCDSYQAIVAGLSSISGMINTTVQREVFKYIVMSLKDPAPLRCYTNNSFLVYMNDTFLNFRSFLTLTSIISVAPETRVAELVNTVTPTELSEFLSVPERIDNSTLLTEVLKNYRQLTLFVEGFNGRTSQLNISKAIKSSILRAVWPMVLSTDSEAELDKWFTKRLIPYLEAFDKNLITSNDTLAAKCLPFRKMVQVLGNSSSSYTDFDRKDVYGTINSYLSKGTKPKCFNATDPTLNSTAWFANYLGPFITFSNKNDIQSFGSTEQLKIFADNPDNLKLMNNELIPQDVRSLYSSLVFAQNATFNISELPDSLLCFAPDNGYSSMKSAELQALTARLLKACNKTINPVIVSGLVGNIQNASAEDLTALGNQSGQLSQGQIDHIQPGDVIQTLTILNTVNWNQGQASLLVKKLFGNGYKLDSANSITSLGTLVQGLPSTTVESVSPEVAVSAAKDPAFVQNIIRGPEVVQQIFVNKIITASAVPSVMLQNIPNEMAGQIPLRLLTFSGNTFNLEQIKNKQWKKEQASLFFDKVAMTNTSYDDLSPSVLQGFSCSAMQNIANNNIVNIIKACRGKKVPLVEDQLSCMAYHVTANASPQDFTSYPVDMLLYYPYSQIPSENCQSYLKATGDANFNVLSETSNKPTALIDSAENCLGITGTRLSSENLNVLNNMVCILNGSYIENSDSLILEKLKKCEQLTGGQIASVQKVLFSGTTKYGNPSTWTQQTLKDLEELPLFLTSEFWSKFNKDDIKSFLKDFLKDKKRNLKKELFRQLGLARRARRAAGCTVGEVTTATINEVAFPIGYDETQFSLCLASNTVKDNLALLTGKVLVENYQTILLQKLNEAYNNKIPEDQLQLLGATSRVATLSDINSWTITKIDTLSALMKSEDGKWAADKSAAIITKYLDAGKTLDAVALKAIGGENLCSLSVSQLKNITAPNLRDAGALDISSCTPEKKKELYNTASAALINQRSDVLTYYNLIKPYLGGAPLEEVQRIAHQNINMDITTFKNLDKDLILKLSPDAVRTLLGNNLRGLESQVNDPVIKEWMSRQVQSTLNSLGVSGVIGIPDPLPSGVLTVLKPVGAGANLIVPHVLQTLFIEPSHNSSGELKISGSSPILPPPKERESGAKQKCATDIGKHNIITMGYHSHSACILVAVTIVIGCFTKSAFAQCNTAQVNGTTFCANVNSTLINSFLETGYLSNGLCNYSIAEYACSSAVNITESMLADLLRCIANNNVNVTKEALKLFFTRVSGVLNGALSAYVNETTTPSPSKALILDVLGEIRVNSFSTENLTNVGLIKELFQTTFKPFLASASVDFLSCLSTKNFSCETYQAVVTGLNNLFSVMDNRGQKWGYTFFMKPFLSRYNASGSSCTSNITNSREWLQKNYGQFVVFALEALDLLTPVQIADLTLDPQVGALNNVGMINKIFDGLLNHSQDRQLYDFFTRFANITMQNNMTVINNTDVRTAMLNRTFAALSPAFPTFNSTIWKDWFQTKLVLLLPSINPGTLETIPKNITCDSYQAIVAGLSSISGMINTTMQHEVFKYIVMSLKGSSCTSNITNSREWLQKNYGQFVVFAEYRDLVNLNSNFSGLEALDLLTPVQIADLTLDPKVGALNNVGMINKIFDGLQNHSQDRQLYDFFTRFANITMQNNMTVINNTDVRTAMLNRTFAALSPAFPTFNSTVWKDWFQTKLVLLLPSINPGTLETIPKNITCDSYQAIVAGLSSISGMINTTMQHEVFKYIVMSLKGSSCTSNITNSREWLQKNYGQFVVFAEYRDLVNLNSNFSGLEALDLLTPVQIADLTLDPKVGALNNVGMINKIFDGLLNHSQDRQLYDFFTRFANITMQLEALDLLTPVQIADLTLDPKVGALNNVGMINKIFDGLQNHSQDRQLYDFFTRFANITMQNNMTVINNTDVRTAMLNRTFAALSPAFPTFNSAVWKDWFQTKLVLLLPSINPGTLETIPKNITCDSYQAIVAGLSSISSMINTTVQREVFKYIVMSLKDPAPLRCYTNNSFLVYMNDTFLNFRSFLTLTSIISVAPETRVAELVNTVTPTELSEFLSVPERIDNSTLLTEVLKNYRQLPLFVEGFNGRTSQLNISKAIKSSILRAVWPTVLSTDSEAELAEWFTKRLIPYLEAFDKNLITSNDTLAAKCLPFRKMVQVLGNSSSSYTDFDRKDVYGTINSYLSKGTKPKCFNATDPTLNSTAWFANYLGPFITFSNKNDIQSFGSTEQLKIFADNPDNLKLMNNELIPLDVRSLYSSLVFAQNATFNISELPDPLFCVAPDNGYSSVKSAELQALTARLLKACNKTINPVIVSGLVGNIQNASAEDLTALGNQSGQLSQGQIDQIQPGDVIQTLTILNTVNWNQGQASLLVKKLFGNGYKLDSANSITSLGTLVQGLPSTTVESVSPEVAVSAAKDPAFVQNIIRGPEVVQQIFVNKIITASAVPSVTLQNIPNEMAGQIPLRLLTFSGNTFNLEQIKNKQWKKEQALLFFDKVASSTTNYIDLSPSVLQGFSCSAMQNIANNNIVNIVKACRGKKVPLVQDQLSCMAYHVTANASPQDFTSYPVDMLLYYPYSKVQTANCQSYLTATGGANLNVLSETNRQNALIDSAKNCLGITGTRLSSENLNVLNNMVCILNGSYIENSDSLILEKLKKCEQLTGGQIASVQKVLFSGTTKYGNPSTWTQQTLKDLEELPLFLTSEFWSKFNKDDRKSFLKDFLKDKKRSLKKELFRQLGLARRARRAAGCTVGEVTTATINEVTFPIDYDETQFSLCLASNTVKDNLALLTGKVLVENYQTILLQKLNEAYNNKIPEDQLQLLGATSRVATLSDINSWTITKIDTLSALMKSEDGKWAADKSAAIITKYLDAGKTLDAVALKAIGGENLCSLSVSQLKNITAPNLRDAGALDISSCTPEKKKELYNTASAALINQRSDVLTYYNLIKPYLAGAPLNEIQRISTQNINMDWTAFMSLDKDVIVKLTPNEVKTILGTNLGEIKNRLQDPTIKAWLLLQQQSALNDLGIIGLTGKPDPVPGGIITAAKPVGAGANLIVPHVLQTLFIGLLIAALQKVL
ncbi:hypothetical protein AOXY_G15435 [Acipenser oxyrinchus oxyrinchus]|uniref:Mesothelin-like protein n=1 Tax=Acipenser oxyrinchus oxyrinchus TaxID=40147 RepID=A0AAD8G4P4_ACIOX|nr:hypothetical protein AOXY_G15435 [Acipenser oxyrinchus oxyrinchus]